MERPCVVMTVDPATGSGVVIVAFEEGKLKCWTTHVTVDFSRPEIGVDAVRNAVKRIHLMSGRTPEKYGIEDQYLGLNVKTLKNLVRVRSWFEYEILHNYDGHVRLISPTTWQNFYGIDSKIPSEKRKEIVYDCMREVFGQEFVSNDVSDALGIAVWMVACEVGEDEIYSIVRKYLVTP